MLNQLQPRLLHAAAFASLMLDVSQHLFRDRTLFDLTPDQRRIVATETQNLLTQARWTVESKAFADLFAVPCTGESAPPGTVLGEPLPHAQTGPGGHFL